MKCPTCKREGAFRSEGWYGKVICKKCDTPKYEYDERISHRLNHIRRDLWAEDYADSEE
jgi:hypothetical protein